MSFFGYVKIPDAVVQLSIEQEYFLLRCSKATALDPMKSSFFTHLQRQRAITEFLKSGNKISEGINYEI
jgi:hypothetical protein